MSSVPSSWFSASFFNTMSQMPIIFSLLLLLLSMLHCFITTHSTHVFLLFFSLLKRKGLQMFLQDTKVWIKINGYQTIEPKYHQINSKKKLCHDFTTAINSISPLPESKFQYWGVYRKIWTLTVIDGVPWTAKSS